MGSKEFKSKPSKKYPIITLQAPYRMLTTMLCRLYNAMDDTSFEISWVLVMVEIVEKGLVFNSEEIMSSNLNQAVKACKEVSQDRPIEFSMSS